MNIYLNLNEFQWLDRSVQESIKRDVTEGHSLEKCKFHLNIFQLNM